MKVFEKETFCCHGLYGSKFTKDKNRPYLIFIHGGPGFNSGLLEYLIEHENLFVGLNYNLILYDQRGCGRSAGFFGNAMHHENLQDLNNIIKNFEALSIKGLIGHSYGAKLLFDFYNTFPSSIPGIFVAMSNTMLTPRMNNFMIDLAYLKSNFPERYNAILPRMDNFNLKTLWELTEELVGLFEENNDRFYLYWANLSWFEKCEAIKKIIHLPVNTHTFLGVRKDLYLDKTTMDVSIDHLKVPYLWINGLHDFMMGSHEHLCNKNANITLFYKSAHYPHIEENERFCERVNRFLE